MDTLKVVVVGNGMVGHHYVDTLAKSEIDAQITVLGGEPHPAYDRVHLSELFDGKKASDLSLASEETYTELGVHAYFGDFVQHIDRGLKVVTTESGKQFEYDKLVLATGSYPFVPPIPGGDQAHCLEYRTIEDLAKIKASAKGKSVGVVVGGGLLGLECANALKNLGLEAHVVEFAPGLMNVQLDQGGSQMLRHKIEELGVKVHTQKATQNIVAGSQHRLKMEFADETELETDMIVFSAGIRPHDQIAKDAGLDIGERGGIVIDSQCRTSDKDIFAIGECALLKNFIYGLVAPGYRMAEAAVSQLQNDSREFTGADMSTKLKLLGVDVGSIGDSKGLTEDSVAVEFVDESDKIYKRLNVSKDGKTLLGATLVGDTSDYDILLQYFLNDLSLPDNIASLVLPGLENDNSALNPVDLPMSAVICSCHNVTKEVIVCALEQGYNSLESIQVQTKASTGCGSCAGLVEGLIAAQQSAESELAEMATA
jgi:nitrite reductase (NADH) large subunit